MKEYKHGWFQVAFERDLKQPINAINMGGRAIILACIEGTWRAFDAFCPHRGAHLAFGGQVEGKVIVCPFHDYQIGLGACSTHGFKVEEYAVLVTAGLVFVRLSPGHDFGFQQAWQTMLTDHVVFPGYDMAVGAPAQLVVENGFDNRHFLAVHGVCNDARFSVTSGEHEELVVEGIFEIPVVEPQRNLTKQHSAPSSYRLRAFSPGITLGQLGGNTPYTVITCATPTTEDRCLLRVSLGLPISHYGPHPPKELATTLLGYIRSGLQQDQVIWDHMNHRQSQRLLPGDHAVAQFQNFCTQFVG